MPSPSPAASWDGPSQASEVTGFSCGSCAASDLVAMSHTYTRLSLVPAASMPPDGLNATELTQSPGPLRKPCDTGRRGEATSHSQTLSSLLPAASTCPDGPNATDITMSAGPVSGLPNDTGLAGSDTDHSRTVLSALPAASS